MNISAASAGAHARSAAAAGFKANDGNPGERLLLGRLRRDLLSSATGSVLDVACGDGINFRNFPDDADITAIDVDSSAASRANLRALALRRKVDVRTMDVHHLNFPDHSFDTVVSTLGLCSYADPLRALKEMSRVCTPGGRILLLEHGRSSFLPWAWWQDRQERRRGPHTGCHENREPLQLVMQAGLHPLTSRRHLLGIIHIIEARPLQLASRGSAGGTDTVLPSAGDDSRLHPTRTSRR